MPSAILDVEERQGSEIAGDKTIYVTPRYAFGRELEALAGKSKLERTQATGLLVAGAVFLALGVYGLVFSALYDVGLVPLIVLSLAFIATGLGVFFGRRFALWLALLLFPFGMVEVLATLAYSVRVAGWYSNNVVAVFNASLILYAAALAISLLLVIDKRKELK